MKFSTHSAHFNLSKNEAVIDAHIQSIDSAHFFIALTDKGNILMLDWDGKNQKTIANVSAFIDLKRATEIYCYGSYFAIVNNRGIGGIVLNSVQVDWSLPLLRGDYCAEVSSYPISFFTRNNQVHLIHGTDWNRLDITNLETKEFLTNRSVADNPEENGFDYFHCKLYCGPDEQNFVTTGWVWHPMDSVFSFNIEVFFKTFERGEIYLDRPVDLNNLDCVFDRPLCFIDKETIAWGENSTPYEATAEQRGKSQLVIQNVRTNEIINTLPFDYFALKTVGNEVNGHIFYDHNTHIFITFSSAHDLTITDKKGLKIASYAFRPDKYAPTAKAALKIQPEKIDVLFWLDE